jgi:hypothetical protein
MVGFESLVPVDIEIENENRQNRHKKEPGETSRTVLSLPGLLVRKVSSLKTPNFLTSVIF